MGQHSVIKADRARSTAGAAIRVLIIDDSLVARTIFQRLLSEDGRFVVVAAVASARLALDVIRREPVDIVLLDLEMPEVGGIAFLPQLLEECGQASVFVVSSSAAEGAAVTLEALALGAADTLQKPSAGQMLGQFSTILTERVAAIASSVRVKETIEPVIVRPTRTAAPKTGIDCVAIGASTGGIHAISEFFKDLSPEMQAPILVTQHLPASFMPYFANQLADMSNRPTTVAREGDRLESGKILVAPGEGHIRLVRGLSGVRIKLDASPAPSRCMPSVDPMFEAVAEIFGARAVAVVLSGMGRDGTIGAKQLVEVGAEVLAQDPKTSVVWGMPGSISEAGLATAVLTPEKLAQRIGDRVRNGA